MDDAHSEKANLLTFAPFEHPILRETMPPVTFPLSREDQQIILDMKYSIQPAQLKAANAAWDAASGMAANQWTLKKRIFLFYPESNSPLEVIINPEYEPLVASNAEIPEEDLGWEACFSVPLRTGCVKRYTHIRVKYQNEAGETIIRELDGWSARVFQHETDHLNGQLYFELPAHQCIDKKQFDSRKSVDDFYESLYETQKRRNQKIAVLCYCGHQKDFNLCCEPYLKGTQIPLTPEALMRSRYTAYKTFDWDYIEKTMQAPALLKFHRPKPNEAPIEWLGLQVVNAYFDINPNIGYVEFIATYRQHQTTDRIHELSQFKRENDRWYYIDGTHYPDD